MTSKTLLATLAALAVLTVADAGRAGQSNSAGAYCGKNADGSGICTGSFNGFLAQTDAQAYAAFWNEGTVYAQFIAELNGTYYSCTSTSPGAQWFAISSAPPTTMFYISWSSNGQCNSVAMQAGSLYQ